MRSTGAFALACAWAGLTVAREPEFHLRSWTTDDGLPHNSVGVVVQDRRGYLWFGTVGGLARFDGREFRSLRPPPELQSLGFNIRGLAEESPGTLIIVTTSRNVLRLSGDRWSLHPVNAALADSSAIPVDVQVAPGGTVWIKTPDARVVRWEPGGKATVFGAGEGIAARLRPLGVATGQKGEAWIAAESLHYVAPGGSPAVVLPSIREPRAIAVGAGGRLWVVGEGRLLRVEHRSIAAEHEIPPESQLGMVRHLFEDRSGAVWLATTRLGLLRVADGRVSRVASAATSFVTEDREGNIWMASDGSGVGRLRAKNYRLFNTNAGLPQDGVSALAEDSRGRMWLAVRAGGLVWIDGDHPPQRADLVGPRAFANVVMPDGEGRIWFGGGRNGLARWAPGGAEPTQLPEPRSDPHLLFRARDGAIWFVGSSGLGFYRGEEVRLLGAEEGYAGADTRAMAQDPAGNIWTGGRVGELLRWDGARFERFDASRGFPRVPIHAIHADANGAIWVGTAAGLVVKEGERFVVLTEAHGLMDDIIQQILEDDRGYLWFAARRGLFCASRAQLLAVARGESGWIDSHRLGPSEGLVGLSPTPNYQPAAWKAADGRLWFATAQGAVAVEPARVPTHLPVPPVLIEEVRVDGASWPMDRPLRVPSGRRRIEVDVGVLSYTAPESVIVRHQLEGAESDWADTGSDRVISYTHLAPGDYKLRVIARNSSGQWNNDGATLAFTIVPAWWETVAFRVSAVALLTITTAWLARRVAQRRLQVRLQRLEQEHALEKERQRIARDLHDDLGASLTELGLMVDRLATRGATEVGPQLAHIAWHTRRLATELSGIVWTMSPRNASLDRLGDYIRQYARRLFRGLPIACVVKNGERLPSLPVSPDLQHQIIATTREVLNNVLKHSHATEVEVDVRCTGDAFVLAIADNGRGFPLEEVANADGNGLRNMRSRAADIGATMEIVSSPGGGTRITLTLPLQSMSKEPSAPCASK